MHDVRAKLKAWQHDFNHCRPHGSLGHGFWRSVTTKITSLKQRAR
jgi:transposase InsO family protein